MTGRTRWFRVALALLVAAALAGGVLWWRSDARLEGQVRAAAGRGDWEQVQGLSLEWQARGSGGIVAPWLVWRSAHRLPDIRESWQARARIETLLRADRAPLARWARTLTDRYPKSAFAWQLRADAACQAGELADGLQAANEALHLAPKDPYSYLARAWIREFSGRREEAIADAQRAVEADPQCAPAHVDLGWLHLNAGHYLVAELECREAMSINPLCTTAQVGMGRALTGLRMYEDAVEMLNRAIALGADNPHVLKDLSAAYEALGEFGLARDCLVRAVRLAITSPHVLLWLMRYDLRHDDSARALVEVEKARSMAPRDASVSYWRAQILHLVGRRREADAELERYLSLAPDRASAYYAAGEARFSRGECEAAIRDFTTSIEARDTALAHAMRSCAYAQVGDDKTALRDADAAVRLEGCPAAYIARARAREALHDRKGAIEDMVEAQRLAPDDPEVQRFAAGLYSAVGDRERLKAANRRLGADAPAANGQHARSLATR